MISHSRLQTVILSALWVVCIHSLSRNMPPTLTISSQVDHANHVLARHYERQIEQLLPFVTGPGGNVFLLKPHQDFTPADHHDALRLLASSGVLTDYRYVDGSQPAILVVTAA